MAGRDLSPEELAQWERIAKSIRRLDGQRRARLNLEIDTENFDPLAEPISLPNPAPAIPVARRDSERSVRRGKIEVASTFDLHGHTQDSAWTLLPAFLQRARRRGERCVLVITGKGQQGEGVIRRNFLRWIDMPEARHIISGVSQAHQRHGGAGAWYVFLRKNKS